MPRLPSRDSLPAKPCTLSASCFSSSLTIEIQECERNSFNNSARSLLFEGELPGLLDLAVMSRILSLPQLAARVFILNTTRQAQKREKHRNAVENIAVGNSGCVLRYSRPKTKASCRKTVASASSAHTPMTTTNCTRLCAATPRSQFGSSHGGHNISTVA